MGGESVAGWHGGLCTEGEGMKIKTREQYYGYLQRFQELMRDDLSLTEDLEFEQLVTLISLYELETLSNENPDD